MANLSHMSIAKAEALGTEKVQALIRNQANSVLSSMSIGKAEALGTSKVNELLNLSQTGINNSNTHEEEKVINNTITAQESLVRRYGIRQEIVIKNNKEDPNVKARRILSENCKPVEEIEVECIGDLDYRVGFGVHVYLPFLSQYSDCLMYIKSIEHEWKPNGMFISKLTLTPSRVMDEKEWSDTTEDDEDSSSSSGSDLWTKIYPLLKQQIGKPYVYGATGPDSFDCSGLVQYCYNQFENEIGFHINRTTYEQLKQGKQIDNTNMDEWEPGDLVFPHDGHVVVYTGDKKCIEAMKTGTNVMEHEYSRNSTYAVRRVLPESLKVYDGGSVDIPTDYLNTIKNGVESNIYTFIKNMDNYGYKNNLISICKKYSIEPYTMAGLICIESEGNPVCGTGSYRGLCQTENGSSDPATNIKQGCEEYNQKCSATGYSSIWVSMSAYNSGEGTVIKACKESGKDMKTISMKELGDALYNYVKSHNPGWNANEKKYYAAKVCLAISILKGKKALN
ncbi:NlpC/P60 family protein [Clostridium butyricum]|uniref:NlpC/P60 family protein n=2 Tax=Clostridium butyricum TaxID=1492 RepID=UPI002ABD8F78|nr:NlpC/P60 family protein [Clostridium butyricum]